VLGPHAAERAIRIAATFIEKARYDQHLAHPIYVAFDEWNVSLQGRDGSTGHGGHYNLSDALAVATYLHAFVRHAHIVKMANLAQLVNVIAPIVTNKDGLFLQSIYHPLRLFADHLGPSSLDVYVECDDRDFSDLPPDQQRERVGDLGPFPVLDAVATLSASKQQLMLSVVNRSPDSDVTAQLQFRGSSTPVRASAEEVNGAEWSTINSFEHPEAVGVQSSSLSNLTSDMHYRFPAHSHTVITVDLS
jgi:alpha-N-arabinofuranosidase